MAASASEWGRVLRPKRSHSLAVAAAVREQVSLILPQWLIGVSLLQPMRALPRMNRKRWVDTMAAARAGGSIRPAEHRSLLELNPPR